MAEALWLQVGGVEYTAAEDRRLIRAMSVAGVVNGLVISATTGLGISVSAGTAVIDAGGGEGYVAYTTAPTLLTMPVSSTTNIYISVNTTTALVTVTAGAAPAAGTYLLLGSVATSGSAITTTLPITPTTRALPENVAGQYLKLSGGAATGEVQAPSLLVPSYFQANATLGNVNAPYGARLGGTGALARCYARATGSAIQNTTSGVWATLSTPTVAYNYAYPGRTAPFNTSTNRFTCPVAGVYTVMGSAHFYAAATPKGDRICAVLRRNAAGGVVWYHEGPQNDAVVTPLGVVGVTASMDCDAGDTLEVQVIQTQGSTLSLYGSVIASGGQRAVSFLLSMAF